MKPASVEQRADFLGGLYGFPADLVQPLGRIAGGRAPDIDHRDRVLPGVQHGGRRPGGELLILPRAQCVADLADLGEFPVQLVTVGDGVLGVARQLPGQDGVSLVRAQPRQERLAA